MNKIITLLNRRVFNTAAPESTFKETGLFKIDTDSIEENQVISMQQVRDYICGGIYNMFDQNNDGSREDEARDTNELIQDKLEFSIFSEDELELYEMAKLTSVKYYVDDIRVEEDYFVIKTK